MTMSSEVKIPPYLQNISTHCLLSTMTWWLLSYRLSLWQPSWILKREILVLFTYFSLRPFFLKTGRPVQLVTTFKARAFKPKPEPDPRIVTVLQERLSKQLSFTATAGATPGSASAPAAAAAAPVAEHRADDSRGLAEPEPRGRRQAQRGGREEGRQEAR